MLPPWSASSIAHFRVPVERELGGVTDAWVEAVAWVQVHVVITQRWFGVIQMAYVVLGRVFGAPAIQQFPHFMFDGHAVVPLFHDVVLVEHMAKEMAVVELENDRFFDLFFGQLFWILPSEFRCSNVLIG